MTDELSAPALTSPGHPRRTSPGIGVGLVRLAVAVLLLAAVATQIADQSINDVFRPEEYFAYFTIQTALVNAAVLAYAGGSALVGRAESELLTLVRTNVTAYAVVTAVVYNLLLRGLPQTGFQGIAWPNEVLHVWVPLIIVLDFAFARGRQRLAWSRLGWAVVYPLAWVAFTLVRAALDGWYPYPFIDPNEPAGVIGVVLHVIGIAAFILALGALGIAVTRIGRADRSGAAGGPRAEGRSRENTEGPGKENTAGPWG